MGRQMIYLDANVIIRLVEAIAPTRRPVEIRLATVLGRPNTIVTSRLSRLECRSKPLRTGNVWNLARFEVLFGGVELTIVDVTEAIIETATNLRAKYNLKTPDAIHYATAIEASATVFLTGDKALAHCAEVPVEII